MPGGVRAVVFAFSGPLRPLRRAALGPRTGVVRGGVPDGAVVHVGGSTSRGARRTLHEHMGAAQPADESDPEVRPKSKKNARDM